MKKVNFWLYKGDVRVTGLYGMFCQFVDEPKEYTFSEEQKKIVFSNLSSKLERLTGKDSAEKIPVIGGLVKYADQANETIEFDEVRIYSTDGELIKAYKIVIGDSIQYVEKG